MASRTPTRKPSAAAAPAVAGSVPPWRLRLLGALEATRGAVQLSRFPSRAAAALMARLALQPDRAHAREELVELLWPGVAIDIGRNRLRQALSTLKALLEADGPPVLLADRVSIRVLPGALDSDVLQFNAALRRGDPESARAWYRGELMPGHYDEWVLQERQRLAAQFERIEAAAVAPAAPVLPSGLPAYWTRSIGAEITASRLQVLVGAQRLVTVHGPGGSGKTRLAVEVATALREGPRLALQQVATAAAFDRLVFVPLVDCRDAVQTLDAIAAALRTEGAGEPRIRVQAALTGSRALLVLDNLEQLLPEADLEIAALLSGLPGLHVLATSRRLLDLDGEHAFELDGLSLPAADAALADAAASPAVALFIDRARAARADFHLAADNLRAVVGLVRLLGGMPLAIELAASRVRALTPAELLRHLSQGAGTPMLDLLSRSSQRTTAGSRHASMRHVVDWSWRQLSPAQAALLGAMSVFAAAAQLAAVAAVADLTPRRAQEMLDELCDACLVRTVPATPSGLRYALQQPVREFAAERFSAQAALLARQRLRAWLLVFVRQAAGQPQALAAEIQHVHAAIVSAPADGAGAEALALAVALRDYWEGDELPVSTLTALEQALTQVTTDDERADAHGLLCHGYGNAGLAEQAMQHADAGLAVAAGDLRRAMALARLVRTLYVVGRFEPDAMAGMLDEALPLARRSGDAFAQASVLRLQALLSSNFRLDYARSEVIALQCHQLWEQAGHTALARVALLNHATMRAWQGHNEEALPVFRQCQQGSRDDADWVGVMHALRQEGRVLIRLRRWSEALEVLRSATRLGWQRHYPRGLANTLINVPDALLMTGHAEAAALVAGFAPAHWARLYGAINRIETAELRRTRRLLRLSLGAVRMEALRLEGAALALPAVVDLVLGSAAT